ncbi:hypothetical protein [Gymnodinialimonas ceratoperidinii]|uniref:Uncharacterized protein n=1 Tax=Gymnodinialimonas ceratoperidinii TaxID=2856823 RepID=A0A8F6TY63_9RHOB|nr:hypothetical protein [Gymnodinialimonas ceratoperidinii]QXT40835.1 hypothetical protein KYE46_06275 [Gymnodinialimonas ceratoperidinii]
MLELDANLPPGALCAATPEPLLAALGPAHWWHGAEPYLDQDTTTGAVTRWRTCNDGPAARPTDPNDGNGQTGTVDDLYGLQCRPGVHCGVVGENAAPDAATATVAIRYYTPPGAEARTLFALNAEEAGNYLFLSEAEGMLTAKDDAGHGEATLTCPAEDAPRLAIVSLFGDRLALSLGPARADAKAATGILSGAANLYIGCRNQRPRLLKTLGSALILDVWLFPGRALLHSDAPADIRARKALQRHHLWASA